MEKDMNISEEEIDEIVNSLIVDDFAPLTTDLNKQDKTEKENNRGDDS